MDWSAGNPTAAGMHQAQGYLHVDHLRERNRKPGNGPYYDDKGLLFLIRLSPQQAVMDSGIRIENHARSTRHRQDVLHHTENN